MRVNAVENKIHDKAMLACAELKTKHDKKGFSYLPFQHWF